MDNMSYPGRQGKYRAPLWGSGDMPGILDNSAGKGSTNKIRKIDIAVDP
jgi:hypothetical protein